MGTACTAAPVALARPRVQWLQGGWTRSLAQNCIFLSASAQFPHGAQSEVPWHRNGNEGARAGGGSGQHPHPSPVNLSLSGELREALGTRGSPGVSESSGAYCVIRPDLQSDTASAFVFPQQWLLQSIIIAHPGVQTHKDLIYSAKYSSRIYFLFYFWSAVAPPA